MKIEKMTEWSWRIPREGPMRTDGVVFADEALLKSVREDQSLQQVANVACLPGIVGYSLGMPSKRGSSRPAAWATTSTAASGSS